VARARVATACVLATIGCSWLVASGAVAGSGGDYVETLCQQAKDGEYCLPGKGEPTPGGGGKVSHAGWPFNNGLYWKVYSSGRGKHGFNGGNKNDELLGHHGSDTITGGGGKDVIWGDWDPDNNNTSQKDVLKGGDGGDFIYSSHGTNRIDSGPGNDHVYSYYGHGTIDCGGGDKDVVWVRSSGSRYSTRNCEIVKHF
jgi:Ca2+-binding RTX toxin-like protein